MPKISAATIAEHKALTRDALLDAMDSLILERTFESISLRDVAARAGVSRTAIYNYAPDTVTLLIDATVRSSAKVLQAVARLAEDTSIAPSERLRAIVSVLLLDHDTSTSALMAELAIERTLKQLQFSRVVLPLRNEIGTYLADVIQAGVDAGQFRAVADPALARALAVGVMQSALRQISDAPTSNSEIADATAQFLINALSGPSVEPGLVS